MRGDSEMSWGGIGVRFVLALVLVYATWNPWGVSFVDWSLMPLIHRTPSTGAAPVKFLLGVVLLVGWVLYLQATRRSLGLAGAALVIATCGGVVWLLASWQLFAMQGPAIAHVILVVLAILLAVGMCWSHLSRRLSGQVDTDAVE